MAEMGIRARMLVKDVMSSPVITVNEKEPVTKVAKLMGKHDLGCIIVTGKDGKPLGIITERDLVTRVLAKNRPRYKLAAKGVMTAPLVTIDPDENLSEAARRMSRLNVRRLGVIYKGELVGVISSKDILAITPELIEIIQEKAKIQGESVTEEATYLQMAGYCDFCGQWSDTLEEVEGSFICEDCKIEMKGEY
ncbi:MAG: CBS domain-containing protein [Candidatus Bathyarchaeota archaeon]|nr:CBS domain-containing protein [Candidatus Bathyarchaeota archaeon]